MGDGEDDHLKFAALGFVDGHGIGQGGLVPFISGVGDFCPLKADGDFILLGVAVLGRQKVADIAQISIEDIAFSIIDQVDNPVSLAEKLVIMRKFDFTFFQGVEEGLGQLVEVINAG